MAGTERLFRFNPFNIKEWKDHEVKEQYEILENSLSFSDTPMELAWDIDVYANMGYLVGEMIARYYELVSVHEVKLDSEIANYIYRERDQWLKEKVEKAPAMSYFENKAKSVYIDGLSEQARLESNLKRFKYAYDSIQDKQNALKKKLESIKFDTFGR